MATTLGNLSEILADVALSAKDKAIVEEAVLASGMRLMGAKEKRAAEIRNDFADELEIREALSDPAKFLADLRVTGAETEVKESSEVLILKGESEEVLLAAGEHVESKKWHCTKIRRGYVVNPPAGKTTKIKDRAKVLRNDPANFDTSMMTITLTPTP